MPQASTEDEWLNEAIAMLERLGVNNPEVGEPGSIPVNPGTFSLEEVHVTDDTGPLTTVRNQFPRHNSERLITGANRPLGDWGNPVCNIFGCALISRLPRTCTRTKVTWTDPNIIADVFPKEIPTATAYLNPFNARIEGDVDAGLNNNSDPGKRHTQKIRKCEQNGPVETEVIEDSAVLDLNSDNEFHDLGSGELIDEVIHQVSNQQPDTQKEDSVSFEKSGALDVIEAIFNVWISGTMRGNFEGTLTAKYEWKGSTHRKEFNIDTVARVPVRNLNYAW